MAPIAKIDRILSEELLRRCAARVTVYDRENRFFQEDFDDLRRAGYLTINIPEDLGGADLSLAEVCRAQRWLAYHAPATALGVNMHLYWVGVAADLWRKGDRSLEWLLREAKAGEIFTAGHAERGNDLPVLLSTARAEKVPGGFRFTGRKMFGSLAPVWTRYGLHGLWVEAEGGPKVVHGFLPRNAEGYRIFETWDTLGMRATRSDDVALEGALVPDRYISRILPTGAIDPFVGSIFAWALLGFANIYYAIAQRAADLVLPSLKKKSPAVLGRSMAYHPEIQHNVAEMTLALDPVGPHLDQVAEEWSWGVDHGPAWPARIMSAKHHAVEACWKVVDLAMEISGDAGMFKSNELERLFRDARCGRFHPANAMLTREVVGKTALGIELGEQPRWG